MSQRTIHTFLWKTAVIRLAVCLVLAVLPSSIAGAQERIFLFFQKNDSQWVDDYLKNSEIADSLSRLIDRIGLENVESIDVTAYASPEGVYENNLRLCRERSTRFGQVVGERLPALSGLVHVRTGGEAWGLLRERVVADSGMDDGLRGRILQILDDPAISDGTRKWRLAHSLGEKAYQYLLDAHYRYLRCFEVLVRFKENPMGQALDTLSVVPEIPTPDEPVVETKPEPELQTEPQTLPETVTQPHDTVSVVKKPVLAISTNIPYDITYIPGYGITSIPSFSLEYYPSSYGRWTVGADVEFPMWQHWDSHRFLQIQNLTLNTRCYLKKGNYRGFYGLVNANVARYGIGWDAKGWEGEGFGFSAGAGYKLSLGGRFFLDAGLALGYFHSRYDPYVYGFDATQRYYYDYLGLPEDFSPRNHSLDWFGPTRVWISVGVELFSRKVRP